MSEPFEVATPTLDARTEGAARQFANFLDLTLRSESAPASTGFWAKLFGGREAKSPSP